MTLPLPKPLDDLAPRTFPEIVGDSPAMQQVFRRVQRVAGTQATVLIGGASGTGKELVARAIHRRSGRPGSFVAVNCAALPLTLVESELFGHEKGAFTDASSSRPGRFEQADGGTLFLDEVAELPLEAQAKVLRALQERTIRRLGSDRRKRLDLRLVAASHRDLEQEVRRGRFREDLYWRLAVFPLTLPSLVERGPDLHLLCQYFLRRLGHELGSEARNIAPGARQLLERHAWPGNVRELENTLAQAMILCEGSTIEVAHLPPRLRADGWFHRPPCDDDLAAAELACLSLSEATHRLERLMIFERLRRHGGNRNKTARCLGISRKTLFNKMRRLRLLPGQLAP